MRVVSVDSETWRIRPGRLTPKLVCVSVAEHRRGKLESWLFDRGDGLGMVRGFLNDKETTIVGQNIPYDMAVFANEDPTLLPMIFKAFEEGRIRDTRIRQKLRDIAHGELDFHWDGEKRVPTKHSLDALVWRHFKRVLPKEGTWRLRYSELDGKKVHEYPAEAKEYALRDAQETLLVFESQGKEVEGDEAVSTLPDEIPQTRAAWALHLMAVWGLRTDPEWTNAFHERLLDEHEAVQEKLRAVGFFRDDGSKDMAVIRGRIETAWAKTGMEAPRTPTGEIATDAETIEAIEHLDEHLATFAASTNSSWMLSAWLPTLLEATKRPINPGFNPLIDTGRTSCSKPNLQNPPRKGGVRECFVPRPGYVYCSCDYDTLELRTLAQACLVFVGESRMAEALKRDEDLHSAFAAQMLGTDYATFVKRLKAGDAQAEEYRQQAKPANFGFPGGMQGASFVAYAKGYGIHIEESRGNELLREWNQAFPEVPKYHNYVKSITRTGDGTVEQLYSKRVRGGLRFTQAANGYFQGLAADGAKDALWHVTKECYLDKTSPLYGSRPVIFLHDEIIAEVREDRASDAAKRQAQIMIERMQAWLPDIPVKASPVLMRRWYKGAKPVFVGDRMVPSKPFKDEKGNTKWIEDRGV